MIRLYQLLVFVIIPFLSSAQRINSEGSKVPEEFRTYHISNYKKLVQGDTLLEKDQIRRSFYIGNCYFLNDLYSSGLVVFGNSINKKLDAIADRLLFDQPGIRQDIHVYLVKSTVPNAFTTIDGGIFINIGLIARLKTEEELAFIMAHEISHYMSKHVITGYQEKVDLEKQQKKSDRLTKLNNRLNHCQFNRDQEFEADHDGLKLFERASYSSQSLPALFQNLKWANFPIYSIKSEGSFMNTKHLQIHEENFQDGHVAYDLNKPNEEDTKYLTHPVPEERLDELLERSQNFSLPLIDQDDFASIILSCQLETLSLYNENYDFFSAVYLASHLTKVYPENEFIRYEMVRAFYGISKFRKSGRRDYIKPSLNHRYNQFFYDTYDFLRKKTSTLDVCAIALAQTQSYVNQNTYRKNEIRTCMTDLYKDYLSIGSSGKHKYVDFSIEDFELSETPINTLTHNYPVDLMKKPVPTQSLVVINPIYQSSLRFVNEDIGFLLRGMRSEFNYHKQLSQELKRIDSELLITSDVLDIDDWNDAILLDNLKEESRLTSVISEYVSRFSLEIEEYTSRTNNTHMLRIGSKTVYGKTDGSYHYGYVTNLLSGSQIYGFDLELPSPITIRGAIGQAKRILKQIQKGK
ncbi:MAG: M48 family metallopeptidase [Flavobacteriales bacterium]|nr:M48 family metallopeptidase [Flavobacteriales bacterium]